MFVQKRSVRIAKHSTSISLEPEFWAELKRIAAAQKISLNQLVARVDDGRSGNLSSALRVFVLKEIETPKVRTASSRTVFSSRREVREKNKIRENHRPIR